MLHLSLIAARRTSAALPAIGAGRTGIVSARRWPTAIPMRDGNVWRGCHGATGHALVVIREATATSFGDGHPPARAALASRARNRRTRTPATPTTASTPGSGTR